MKHKSWIKALDLVNWSDRRDAQEILPRLIRRLIYASCRDISYRSFPADESVQSGGWDGILKGIIKGNEYVPQGDSAWEISVRSDKSKADEDYEKRTKDPKNTIQKDTTYIFVTSRQYTNKEVWMNEKKEQNKWKDVRYYDADAMEQWLEICPVVNYWFSRLCGKQPDDVIDLEEFWYNFSKDTRPYLTPDIIVNDRSEEKQKIISWLKAPPSQLLCSAESKKEAIAFLISVIKQLTDNEQDEFFSKSLIVKNYSSWKELLYFQESLILIPDITEHINTNIAIERGHYVFLPAEQEEIINNKNSFILNRLKRNKLEESLQVIGLSCEESRDIAGKSGGSLTYLRLLLLSPETPEWIKPEQVSKLVPFILLGRWNDNNKKDREVLEKLTNDSYTNLLLLLNTLSHIPESPIHKVNNVWKFVSREVTWLHLNKYVLSSYLDTFKIEALNILKEINPMYDLVSEERWLANIKGKILSYSNSIRQGICDTLALLSSPVSSDKFSAYSRSIVYELLDKANDWKLWASLSNLLPLLSEAASDEFLKAVENNLDKGIFNLFQEQDSSNPHVGLLWALENVALETVYLSKVTLIMAKLSHIASNKNHGNNPMDSLVRIFLTWHPQTKATVSERLEILSLLITKEGDIGWKLLLSILPKYNQISFPTHKPRWKKWYKDFESEIAYKEIHDYTDGILRLIYENVNNHNNRWLDILEDLHNYPPSAINQLLLKLKNYLRIEENEENLYKIKENLRNILYKHRYFSGADWAMSSEILNDIEIIFNGIEINNPVYKWKWLFLFDYNVKLFDGGLKDRKENSKLIKSIRENSAKEIISLYNLDTILELAKNFEASYSLGRVISHVIEDENIELELFQKTLCESNEKISSFIEGYINGRFENNNWKWVEKYLNSDYIQKCSESDVLNIALKLPPSDYLWNIVENLNIKEAYWKNISIGYLINKDDSIKAVTELLNAGRPWAALDTIPINESCFSSELIYLTLKKMQEFSVKGTENMPRYSNTVWEISSMLDILEKSGEIPETELVSLEWFFFPLIGHYGRGAPLINKYLSKDPSFFTEILSFVYKSKNDTLDNRNEEISEEIEIRAELASRLLNNWKLVSELSEENIDYKQLYEWVTEVRKICKNDGRLKAADLTIGRTLAYSPIDSDGNWPHIAIRDLIEELASDNIDESLQWGIFSKRGVITRSAYEGGQQERDLADKYRKWADKLAIKWPRTANILRSISDTYLRQAEREDEEAKLEEYDF